MRTRPRFLHLLRLFPILVMAAAPVSAQQAVETSIPDKVRLFIPYKDYSAEDNKRILDMYSWLRVADVSDGMDVVGLQDVGLVDPEGHALWKDKATGQNPWAKGGQR